MFAWLDLVTAIWIAVLKLVALPLMPAFYVV